MLNRVTNGVPAQSCEDLGSKSSKVDVVSYVPSGDREVSGHSFMPEVSIPIEEPTQPNVNTHHMVTQSKVGIFKPKVLSVEAAKREP